MADPGQPGSDSPVATAAANGKNNGVLTISYSDEGTAPAAEAEVSAIERVLNTTELLEGVLLEVDDMKTVLLAQRVSKRWEGTIRESPGLQEMLWFRRAKGKSEGEDREPWKVNPLIFSQFAEKCYGDEEHLFGHKYLHHGEWRCQAGPVLKFIRDCDKYDSIDPECMTCWDSIYQLPPGSWKDTLQVNHRGTKIYDVDYRGEGGVHHRCLFTRISVEGNCTAGRFVDLIKQEIKKESARLDKLRGN